MASLKTLLKTKYNNVSNQEENLETGQIWVYQQANIRTKLPYGFCWKAPSAGTAVIEAWGAGGSAGRMCCCGFGVPGNSGSYSKKTIRVTTGCYVCGDIGFSCGNTDLCFRGCSEPTVLCWFGCGTNGCICAQGGRGGTSYCSTTPSAYCCFTAGGFCTTKTSNENCGIVCNYGSGTASCCAQAYGGDVNCYGRFNCASFFGCYPSCTCQYQFHIYVPPGFISDGGSVVTYNTENDNGTSNWSGYGIMNLIAAINAAGKQPTQSNHYTACWSGNRTCGCYEANGCMPFLPPGVGGHPPHPCADVRDMGYRGGHGAVRIKFIAD